MKRVEKEYYVDHEKLNSLNYGVPQHREHVFFIGIRKDCLNKQAIEQALFGKWFPFPVNEKYHDSATKYNWGKQVPFGNKLKKPKGTSSGFFPEEVLWIWGLNKPVLK